MNKKEIFKYTTIAVLICVFVFMVPLTIVTYYSDINNNGAMGITFKDLHNSGLTTEQQTHLTILRKSCDYNLTRVKEGQSFLYIYFIVIISIIILLSGISLMKEQPTRFKICLLLYIAFFIGILIYILIYPKG